MLKKLLLSIITVSLLTIAPASLASGNDGATDAAANSNNQTTDAGNSGGSNTSADNAQDNTDSSNANQDEASNGESGNNANEGSNDDAGNSGADQNADNNADGGNDSGDDSGNDGEGQSENELLVSGLWARASIPSSRNSSAYLVINNPSNREYVILAANAPSFANNVELHNSFVDEKGISRMTTIDKDFNLSLPKINVNKRKAPKKGPFL